MRARTSRPPRAPERARQRTARLLLERIEHDFLGEPVQAKLVAHGAQRMVRRDDVGEAKAREYSSRVAPRRRAT